MTNFIDKQGDRSEHSHGGVATFGPVRAQTKSGVASRTIPPVYCFTLGGNFSESLAGQMQGAMAQ